MAKIYLQMPPEQGNTRFGPIESMVQFGADPRRCQIVLGHQHGIAPAHATLMVQPDGSLIIQPIQQGLAVFVVQAGNPQLRPLQGAAEIQPGDALVLGNMSGPRFLIQREVDHIQGGALDSRSFTGSVGDILAGKRPRAGNLIEGVAAEAVRRQKASLMARNPLYRSAHQLMWRLRGGAWKSPYFIVSVLGALLSVMLAGAAGIGAVLWQFADW